MTIASGSSLQELQALVTNRLDPPALQGKRLCAILGDVPSTYAKSPKLWNAAFQALAVPAVFVPLDVPAGRLGEVVASLRRNESFLGGSVTVPYKIEILPLLDRLDPLAERIGAVNVIARGADGALTGYNTDGLGGLRSLTHPTMSLRGMPAERLKTARVLLLGAGGAAKAVACYLWDAMPGGSIVIANRHRDAAAALGERLRGLHGGSIEASGEEGIADAAAKADLIVNASLKGQAGIRKTPDGRWTTFEAYSALGPAAPTAIPPMPGGEAGFPDAWFAQSKDDVRRNHDASVAAWARVPRETFYFDCIYSPLETVAMRHARATGHAVMNGKEMNVIQAVEAFMQFVCRDWLASQGMSGETVYRRVAEAMAAEWAK